MKKYDIQTGKMYGGWTVIEKRGSRNFSRLWLCKCECGVEKEVVGRTLFNGTSTSCGCRKRAKNVGAFRAFIRGYKRGAVARGLEWSLSDTIIYELTQKPCFYCGALPSQIIKKRTSKSERSVVGYVYNGIDRRDNKIGYISENVVPCCGECNRAKTDKSVAEFSMWVTRVYNHNPDSWIEGIT